MAELLCKRHASSMALSIEEENHALLKSLHNAEMQEKGLEKTVGELRKEIKRLQESAVHKSLLVAEKRIEMRDTLLAEQRKENEKLRQCEQMQTIKLVEAREEHEKEMAQVKQEVEKLKSIIPTTDISDTETLQLQQGIQEEAVILRRSTRRRKASRRVYE